MADENTVFISALNFILKYISFYFKIEIENCHTSYSELPYIFCFVSIFEQNKYHIFKERKKFY